MLSLFAAMRSPRALTQGESNAGSGRGMPELSPLPSALCWAGSVLLMLGDGFVAGEGDSGLLCLHLLPLCLLWALF